MWCVYAQGVELKGSKGFTKYVITFLEMNKVYDLVGQRSYMYQQEVSIMFTR